MHQTTREFLIRTIPNATSLNFEIGHNAHRVITTTCIRYLMLCFTSPSMRDYFSQNMRWSQRDFRAYAEYLSKWPLIEYTLRYIKDHHDIGGQNEEVSRLVTTLVRQLVDNQASYFLGNWIAVHLGHNNRQAIPVNVHQETSVNIKYSTLIAAAEPELPQLVRSLLLTCTQEDHAQRKTPLIISAQKRLAGATRLFLELNMDKDAKDNSGRTALHYAAENGDTIIRRQHCIQLLRSCEFAP
jgi:hypothetical protein